MSDSVKQYLNEIGAVAPLNAQEERELYQTIERGVEARQRKEQGERGRDINKAIRNADAAKDRFIRANLRLVVSVARRYPLPPGMELLDLIQEGNLGLEHAVDKFDWRKGFKFSTYATFWIRQAIGRALDQKASLVRLPGDRSASLRAALRQVSGDGDELDDEHARLHRLTTPTSLDRIIGNDGFDADPEDDSNEPICLLPLPGSGPEVEVLEAEEKEMVTDLLDILEDRAKHAVSQHFGLIDGRERSYREVGEELGVTAEAARRLVKRAIISVRDYAGTTRLDETINSVRDYAGTTRPAETIISVPDHAVGTRLAETVDSVPDHAETTRPAETVNSVPDHAETTRPAETIDSVPTTPRPSYRPLRSPTWDDCVLRPYPRPRRAL